MKRYDTRAIGDLIYVVKNTVVWECEIKSINLTKNSYGDVEVSYKCWKRCEAISKGEDAWLGKDDGIYDSESAAIRAYLEDFSAQLLKSAKSALTCKVTVDVAMNVPF